MLKRIATIVLCALPLAGCATLGGQPMAVSHDYVTPDAKHWAVQISMHTGMSNTPQQTVMIIYNQASRTPIAIVEGQTKTMSEELMGQVINAVTSFGTAGITGNFLLQAAQADCPPGSLCGTLVQVQNSAGASADSSADASSI